MTIKLQKFYVPRRPELDSPAVREAMMKAAPPLEPFFMMVEVRRPKVTRQGVRNLNGPRMDGWDHNGHRVNCRHESSLTFDEYSAYFGRMLRVKRCAFCNTLIGES